MAIYSVLFGHLSSQSKSVGQIARTGDVCGIMGTTGSSTGIHLHLSVIPIQRTTRWLQANVPSYGGTRDHITNFIGTPENQSTSRIFGAWGWDINTEFWGDNRTGWYTYTDHYALDIDDWPESSRADITVRWPLAPAGTVMQTDDQGSLYLGKSMVLMWETTAALSSNPLYASAGSTVTLSGGYGYRLRYVPNATSGDWLIIPTGGSFVVNRQWSASGYVWYETSYGGYTGYVLADNTDQIFTGSGLSWIGNAAGSAIRGKVWIGDASGVPRSGKAIWIGDSAGIPRSGK